MHELRCFRSDMHSCTLWFMCSCYYYVLYLSTPTTHVHHYYYGTSLQGNHHGDIPSSNQTLSAGIKSVHEHFDRGCTHLPGHFCIVLFIYGFSRGKWIPIMGVSPNQYRIMKRRRNKTLFFYSSMMSQRGRTIVQ